MVSVTKRSDGTYCASLQVNGKRRYVYGRTEREARRKLELLKREAILNEGLPSYGGRTLNDLLDAWLETATPVLRPRTIEEYRKVCDNYIRPALGGVKLDRLTPLHIQRLLNDLQGRGLKRTPQYVHTSLHRALRLAVLWGWLTTNPTERTVRPKYRAERREIWSKGELTTFLCGARSHWLYPVWVVLLATGMRLSEALALKWSDVGSETVRISSSLHRVRGRVIKTDPKSWAGRREIPLPEVAQTALRKQRAQQAEWKLKAGSCWVESDHAFTGLLGQPPHPSVVQKALKRECVRLGVRPVTPHCLRHFAASALLAQGFGLVDTAKHLGHADTATTLRIYAHSLGRDKEAGRLMQAVLKDAGAG